MTGEAVTAAYRAAVEHHQAGQLAAAERLYREVLAARPDHAEALHLLGVLAHQNGDHGLAASLIGDAIRRNGTAADYHNNLGNVRQAQGRLEDAVACFRAAIALAPRYAKAHFNLGNALLALGDRHEATRSFERALAIEPAFVDAIINLGACLHRLGHLDQAVEHLRRAVALAPGRADALYNLATALQEQGDAGAAEAFRRVLALVPDYAPALNNLGTLLLSEGKAGAARPLFEKALSVAPNSIDVLVNLGAARMAEGDADAAIGVYRRALEISPGDVRVRHNLAVALQQRGDMADALVAFDDALRLAPDDAELRFNRALALLLDGQFPEGWRELEWRWRAPQLSGKRRVFERPLWQGEAPQERTILLHAEQGFGDTIQFVRYAPLVAERGAKVVLEVPSELLELCRSLPGIASLVARGEDLPAFDFHCPLMSLPGAFATAADTIPAAVPYLRAPSDRAAAWRTRLADRLKPRIGLAWAGNPAHKNDRNRSVPADALAPLLALDGVTFVSLQKPGPAGAAGLVDIGSALVDFADTAAAILQLDLVIAVDTAVAHLSGALGVPCWVLLPQAPDWRWMLSRGDSPWYPSLTLWRQEIPGDWATTLARVADALAALIRRPSGEFACQA